MAELDVIKLNGGKAFPNGTKLSAISYQWLDENDDPIDLSTGTWTGQGRAEALDGGSAGAGLGTGGVSVDTANARATYVPHEDDFATAGRFRLIIWIGNGTTRYGSAVFEWQVADAPGADPSV